MMKNVLKFLVPAAVVAGLLYWLIAGSTPVVQVAVVNRETAVNAVPGNVTVESVVRTVLRVPDAGRIIETAMSPEGVVHEVTAGQVVARLDSREADLQLETLSAEIATLEQQIAVGPPEELTLENLQQDLQIKRNMQREGEFAEADLRKLEREIKRLERQILQEKLLWENELTKLRARRQEMTLAREQQVVRAPVDGYLTDVAATTGDYLFEGDALATFLSEDKRVVVSLSEQDFSGVRPGLKAMVRFLGLDRDAIAATVTEVAPLANAETRRRDCYVELSEDLGSGLVAGMTGEASVVKESREDALVIPRLALDFETEQVWVLTEGERVQRRAIKVGFVGLRLVEVVEGLEAGARVVVSDPSALTDGLAVTAIPYED